MPLMASHETSFPPIFSVLLWPSLNFLIWSDPVKGEVQPGLVVIREEAASNRAVTGEEAIATVDHCIRGSKPHNDGSSGAASD